MATENNSDFYPTSQPWNKFTWGTSAPLSIITKLHPIDIAARDHDAGDLAAIAANFELFTLLAKWFARANGGDEVKHTVRSVLEQCAKGSALSHEAITDLEAFPDSHIEELLIAYDLARDALSWLCFYQYVPDNMRSLVCEMFDDHSNKAENGRHKWGVGRISEEEMLGVKEGRYAKNDNGAAGNSVPTQGEDNMRVAWRAAVKLLDGREAVLPQVYFSTSDDFANCEGPAMNAALAKADEVAGGPENILEFSSWSIGTPSPVGNTVPLLSTKAQWFAMLGKLGHPVPDVIDDPSGAIPWMTERPRSSRQ
jgi:hypothetical protein